MSFAITYNRLDTLGNLLPPSQETLMLFMASLSMTHKPGTIKTYLQAVRNLRVEHGYANPLQDAPGVRRLLWGIKRTYGDGTNNRLPITPAILVKFFSLLNLTAHDHILIWAALLTAFFGFLRSSELVSLNVADVCFEGEKYHVTLRASKTDPFRTGAIVTLCTANHPFLCPVRALSAWSRIGPRHGCLFLWGVIPIKIHLLNFRPLSQEWGSFVQLGGPCVKGIICAA